MSVKEKAWYPVVFMFAVTLVLSAIIIVFGSLTRDRVKSNERIAFERAALQALPIDLPEDAGPQKIHRMFTENIADSTDETGGALRYMKGDSVIAYALPIEGAGFWAPIKGVIGIAADKRTVTGIAFYEQNETPGLGGEIVKIEFRSQFQGKVLSVDGVPLEIRMGTEELDESSVHAITGATQTSVRLGKFLADDIERWQQSMGVR
jgi:Na+-transporting NADH:ubiquinone oxidoreductase subunit C